MKVENGDRLTQLISNRLGFLFELKGLSTEHFRCKFVYLTNKSTLKKPIKLFFITFAFNPVTI